MKPCSDYECCSRVEWEVETGAGAKINLKMLKLLQVFGLVLYTFVLNIWIKWFYAYIKSPWD